MARRIVVLAGFCVASLFRPLGALSAWQAPSDGVLLLQEAVRVHGAGDGVAQEGHENATEHVAELAVRGPARAPAAAAEAEVLAHQKQSETGGIFLPSLVEVSVPLLVVGAALVAVALLWTCRGLKGACCCFSGCCGGSLLVLALALIIAKVVLSRMAGPAPVGPIPVEPPETRMEVEGRIPFTVSQINAPGPIHDVYKAGMQSVLDLAAIATGVTHSDIVVEDVEARAASGEEVSAPVMISVGGAQKPAGDLQAHAAGEEVASPVMISVGGAQKPFGDLRSEKTLEEIRSGKRCQDDPADWQSSTGYGCQSYQSHLWCTEDGGYGSGWEESWGTFQDYASSEKSAVTVCCACGGGYRVSQNQQVYLSYTMSTAANMSLRQRSAPDITNSMVNQAIRKLASEYSKGGNESFEGLHYMEEIASGEFEALQGDATMHVSVNAHFRCQVHHSLSADMQDGARIVLKDKMPEVKEAFEKAAKDSSSLHLVLADRCNDPSQLDAMQLCVGKSLIWADLVSVGSVSVPFDETVDDFLCRKSCVIQSSLKQYKDEAMKEANAQTPLLTLDEHTIWGTTCFPFLDKSKSCSC